MKNDLSKFKDLSLKKNDQLKLKGGIGNNEPQPTRTNLSKEEKACLEELGRSKTNGNGNGLW